MTPRSKRTGLIFLAEEQLEHIEGLINSALLSGGKSPEFIARLRALKSEIDKAKVVPGEKLPPDVVRIGSWVEIEDLGDGFVEQFQLVYPEYSDLSIGRISLMTPMGIALVGEKAQTEVSYEAPSGPHRIFIRRVSAEPFGPVPEAAPYPKYPNAVSAPPTGVD